MTDFNKVKLYLKFIYNNFNNRNSSNELKKNINEYIKYISELNLTNNDKYYFLNLLLFYKIDRKFFDINKKKSLFNKICLSYFSDTELLKYSGFLNKLVHEYLYNKIMNNNFNLDLFIQQIEQPNKHLINQSNNQSIKEEIIKINTFIDNNNYLNKLYNSCEINKNVKINIHDIGYEIEKIKIKNKGHYQLPLTKYYDETFNLHSFQCFFKAAINFFLNNSSFNGFFIDRNIVNKQYNIIEKELIINKPKLNELSDFIQTESLGGADEFLKYKDNAYIDLYNCFKDMIQNSLNLPENIKNNNLPDKYKNIEKSYDNYIKFKNIINSYLSDKYKLGVPGFKIYPFFVIQDILNILKDNFANNCIIEYNNNENKTYILDCIKNDFLDFIKQNKSGPIIKIKFNNPESLRFYKENKIYYYNDNIISYLQNISNTPKNLLIACPINDICAFYMLNNKIDLKKYKYDDIKNLIINIKNKYYVSIKYPLIIDLNNERYYLHSYIIVVNNFEKYIDDHFIYHKILYKDFYKYAGIERFDTFKSKVLKEDNLNDISPDYIKYEILYKEDKENKKEYLQDNLSNKIVFCYYRKITQL